jgi:MFS family permease
MKPSAQGVVVIGLAGLAAAMGIGRFALTPILPLLAEHGGVTLREGSALAASNYAGYLAGALACALLPVNPGRLARVGLFAVALFTLAMGLTAHFMAWLSWLFAAGVASAFVLVGVSAWTLQNLAGSGRAHWAGGVFAGVGVGIAFAGAAVLVVGVPDLAWITLGICALAVTAFAWRPLATPNAVRQSSTQPARLGARAWLLIACYGAFGFGYIVPATYLPSLARASLGGSAAVAALWPIFGVAAAITTVTAAVVLRNVAPRRVWAASHLVMAVGVVAPALAPGMAALLVAAIAVGGTFMIVTMAGMQEARRIAGDASARLMAAMTAAFAVGQLAGPIVVALLASHPQPLHVSSIAAAVLLVASAATLALS